jgi:hypothetical protein
MLKTIKITTPTNNLKAGIKDSKNVSVNKRPITINRKSPKQKQIVIIRTK